MRPASMLALPALTLFVAALTACGGATETVDFSSPDDGVGDGHDAGLDAAIDDEEGGSGDAEPDGDGAADAEIPAVPCAPPTDPTKAALCLLIEPEPIAFSADDEKLDGKGILHVEIFDKARPSEIDAPLQMRTAPGQPGSGYSTQSLAELTAAPIRFEGLPTTVYPRIFFVDDVEGAKPDTLTPGTWIGGIDLSNGLVEDMPLESVSLKAGEGTTVKTTLTALRKLTVTVSRTANPAQGGNAQGSLTVVALSSQELDQNARVFGLGEKNCADVSDAKTAVVEGVVVGKGPYWVTGVLDDFGVGGEIPPGALVSITPFTVKIPDQNKVSYAADAYAVASSIQLSFAIPRQGGGADAVSCP